MKEFHLDSQLPRMETCMSNICVQKSRRVKNNKMKTFLIPTEQQILDLLNIKVNTSDDVIYNYNTENPFKADVPTSYDILDPGYRRRSRA